jgi:aspartate carbamoyltransferase catalytic subunit
VPVLRGKTIVNAVLRGSTRTRISFEFAEKRLSADTVNIARAAPRAKGETLVDTARNLEAMRIDMVVIRHGSSGAAQFLASASPSNVINAGDGRTSTRRRGCSTCSPSATTAAARRAAVCIVGDVLHSRVARSNIWGLRKLGAEVAVCGPRTLLPRDVEELGVQRLPRVEEAIEWADVLNVLRLQLERMQAASCPRLREYNRVFGVTRERRRARAARPADPAPRPDEPRRRDRQRRRGRARTR